MFKNDKESVAEFLRRGGKINKIPPVKAETQETVRPNSSGPVTIMSLEEADLFYGEPEAVKHTATKSSKIDLTLLPAPLKEKLLAKLADKGYSYDDEEEE